MPDVVMTAHELACWRYRTDEPKPSQLNTVTHECRNGIIRNAEQVGRTWHVNCTREWPLLFPPDDGGNAELLARVDGKLDELGRLLCALGEALKGEGHGE